MEEMGRPCGGEIRRYFENGTQEQRETIVADAARAYLRALPTDAPLTTAALSEALWPIAHYKGEAIAVRRKMVNTLLRLADTTLHECATRLAPRYGRGPLRHKLVRPLAWHRPMPAPNGTSRHIYCCPNCLENLAFDEAGDVLVRA